MGGMRKRSCKHEPQYSNQQFCYCMLCGRLIWHRWSKGIWKWVLQ